MEKERTMGRPFTEEEKLIHRMFMKSEITNLFQEDPLYKQVESKNLMHQFFEEENENSIVELDFTKDYSTKEVADFLGKSGKEYQLNNLLARKELGDYFQVSRIGTAKHYRYNWSAIIRFKLVFLLMTEANFKPSDIVGIIEESGILKELEEEVEPEPNPLQEEVDQLQERMDSLEKQTRQFKQVLVEERKVYQQAKEKTLEEVAMKEARFVEQFRGFLDSHYEHQLLFFKKLDDCLAEEIALQQKDKGFFNWREKTTIPLSSLQKLQEILQEEQDFLEEERYVKPPIERNGWEMIF